jgi:hypothetical protein
MVNKLPILTKYTITSHLSSLTSHLNSLNITKTMTYDVGNPCSGFGQAQKCGWVKPVNGIPTLPSG